MALDPESGLGVPTNPTLKALDVITEFSKLIPGDRDGRCESDALRCGGDYSPGLAVVRRAGIPVKWDKRSGYGYAGAWVIYTGDDLSEFEVEFTLTTQTQVTEWKAWRKKYLTKASQVSSSAAFLPSPVQPKAIGVYHPILAEVEIDKVVWKHIHQFDQPANGRWVKVVEFIQFKPPKPLLGRPNGATPAAQKVGVTAQDAVQLEQRAVTQDIDALEKKLAQVKAGGG